MSAAASAHGSSPEKTPLLAARGMGQSDLERGGKQVEEGQSAPAVATTSPTCLGSLRWGFVLVVLVLLCGATLSWNGHAARSSFSLPINVDDLKHSVGDLKNTAANTWTSYCQHVEGWVEAMFGNAAD